MTKRVLISLLLSVISISVSAQVTVKTETIFAPFLQDSTTFSIVLPQGYDATRTYPVFYLLHGYGGDHTNWLRLTGLRFYARDWSAIIVMPDGKNSFYMNSASNELAKFEDLIIKDITSHVESNYAVDTSKQGIGGLSMGGYGAIMLGTLHSDRFIFAGGLSGVILPWRNYPTETEAYIRLREGVLRPLLGPDGHENYARYDIIEIINREHATQPYIFLAHGIQDSYREFLPGHRLYTKLLSEKGWPYEYHEVPGVHNWTFWDHWLQPMMESFLKVASN